MASPSRHNEPLLPNGGTSGSKPASKLLTVCPFILGNEFCERLAFYGLATNMIIYLTDVMGLDAGNAGMQVSLFEGTCYMTPLLGAWLADCYWGRFKTILVFSIIYALGMFGMAASAIVPGLQPAHGEGHGEVQANVLQLTVFYGCLYVVATGTGGIKPNVSAFGADQFDDKIKQDRRDKQSFFNWFYFSINIGSLIACTVIVWIQGFNWGLGFAIPAVAMAIAVLCFVAGYRLYKHQQPMGSPITRVVNITLLSIRCSIGRMFRGKSAPPPAVATDEEEEDNGRTLQVSQTLFASAIEVARSEAAEEDSLSRAGRLLGYSHEKTEEVRMVLRMFPIFLLTIMYWAVYTQMSSVFVLQGQHMNRNIDWGLGEFVIPAASLTMFNTIAIVVLIPIYDGIFNPLMKRIGCAFTMLQRIGWGMLAAALAMIAAAVVERHRMAALAAGTNITVMEQMTQYLLVGLSEVLASIGQMEFFYDQAPDVMRSCCMALQLLSTALGGYASAGFMYFVHRYTTWLSDLNHGSRLDLYFLLLAAVMLINTVMFVGVAMAYRYKVVKHRSPVPLIGGQQAGLQSWQRQPQIVTGVQPAQQVPSGHSMAIPIGARPQAGYGYQYAGTPMSATPDVGPYGRSVTYMPQTPLLPPNFR